MKTDLTDVPNIGPATAKALIAAGIPDQAALRGMGADEAYRQLLENGESPHFIGYYVLHMALQGRPWNDCRGEEKVAFRVRFDALVADIRGAPLAGIEAALDEIGLRQSERG